MTLNLGSQLQAFAISEKVKFAASVAAGALTEEGVVVLS